MMKSVHDAKTALPFSGPGKADPDPCWTLQREMPLTLTGELALHSGEMVLPLTTGEGEPTLLAWR